MGLASVCLSEYCYIYMCLISLIVFKHFELLRNTHRE